MKSGINVENKRSLKQTSLEIEKFNNKNHVPANSETKLISRSLIWYLLLLIFLLDDKI